MYYSRESHCGHFDIGSPRYDSFASCLWIFLMYVSIVYDSATEAVAIVTVTDIYMTLTITISMTFD